MSVDLPRNGFVQPVEIVGGGGGGIDVIVNGLKQVQNTESVAALGAGATVTGSSRDCINYESFGISVFLDPLAGQAINVTVLVENSRDGVTFRQVDSVTLVGATDANMYLNRVYSATRQYYRVSLINNDATHALTSTELISMQKPV
jgi:hypothetical protein